MAARREILDAVYDELVSYATGDFTVTFDDGSTETLTLDSGDVDLVNPEYEEKVPGVFYEPLAHNHLEFNGVGNAPDRTVLDSNGDVDYVQWTEHVEGFYILYVRAQTPAHREPVYESVRRGFEKYEQGRWDPSDIHADIDNLRIEVSRPANSPNEEDAIWGDQIELYVRFKRKFILESGGSTTMDEAVEAVENVTQVNLEADLDLDDQTTGFTYTIT